MPEADYLRLTALRLQQRLGGHALVSAQLRWPSLAGAELNGRTLLETTSYGKNLLMRFDDGGAASRGTVTLHSHLRMDGDWITMRTGTRPGADRSPWLRAVLVTEPWTAHGQLLGMLNLVPTHAEHRVLGHLGPDVLELNTELRKIAAANLVASGTRAVCASLLDQRVVAGIGTIWMAETLFELRRYPWTLSGALSPAQAEQIVATAARLISRSVRISLLRREADVPYSVHGQHRKFCRRCGEPIAVAALSGPGNPPDQGAGDRIVFWCPGCQA